MRRLLLLIPLLFGLLACNFGVMTFQDSPITSTVSPQSIPTNIPLEATFTFTPEPPPGRITGKLSYPSEFIPAMRVVAFSLTDGEAYFVDTAKGQGDYSITVPAGNYYVVSYPYEGIVGNIGQADSYTFEGGTGLAGGYSQMVPCGLSVGCEDHTLLQVTVSAGQTVQADPGDWYASPGTFPPMPNP